MYEPIVAILSMLPIYILGTNGELLSQLSGVYNIGIEGVMAFGAILAIISYNFIIPNLWISMLVGAFGGVIFGVLNSILSIRFKLDQIVVGFGLWFFGIGLAGFIQTTFLAGSAPIERFSAVLFDLDPIFYLSIIVGIVLWIFVSKTSLGLTVRAVGENPRAADSLGINVDKVRWLCVLAGCALIGMSGAYLYMNYLQGFRTMVSGFGWMCFALVMFARWKVLNTFVGATVFSAIIGIQSRMQVAGIVIIPVEFLSVLPHIAVIIVLVAACVTAKFGKSAMPSALGTPYIKEAIY